MKEKGIINLLGKMYTYKMLKNLNEGPKRFKAIGDACFNEKMRTERLRELESLKLIDVNVERIGRRAVSFYSLSNKGKKTLKLAEEIKKLESKRS